ALLGAMSPVDFILVEGFKRNAHIKIEVHRQANGKPWLYPDDPSIGAIASDIKPTSAALPWVSLDDCAAVADLVVSLAWPLPLALERLGAQPVRPAARPDRCLPPFGSQPPHTPSAMPE